MRSIWSKPSTLTPIQTLAGQLKKESNADNRSARFVRTWKRCQLA